MNVKSLVLGSAAAILAVTGAQAADLPVAEPVEYVRICDTYGTGFYYIPGTETCLRVGGRIRAELRYLEPIVPSTRLENHTATTARAYINLDARTQTEYGLVRAYFQIISSFGTGGGIGNNAGVTGTTPFRAFIQFGGFTAGRAASFFNYFGLHYGAPTDGAYAAHTTNLFAYTLALGNGFFASISLEDGVINRAGVTDSLGNSVNGGHVVPDVVVQLRIDQGWGNAQLAAAIHQIRANASPTTTFTTGNTTSTLDSEIGWAVMAGLTINLPVLAAGDQFMLHGAYSDGAIEYVGATNGAWSGVRNSNAVVAIPAGTTRPRFYTAKAWSIGAAFAHNWTPQFATTLSGTYINVNYPSPINLSGTNDWTAYNIFLTNVWTPVSGLSLGIEVGYESVDVAGRTSCVGGTTTACDYNRWSGIFRVQRDW